MSNKRRAGILSALALYFAAFYLFGFAANLSTLPDDPHGIALLFALLTAWLGASVGIVLVWTYLRSGSEHPVVPLITRGIAVDLVCNILAARLYHSLTTHGAATVPLLPGGGHTFAWLLCLALLALGNLGVLAAACGAGVLVARGLQKPNYLILAAIVGAVTDIFSVYAGPSKHVLSSSIFPYLSFGWGVWGQGIIPCVGAGDFIFLALYFSGAQRFGLDERKTLGAMVAAFGLGFLCLLFSPSGVPALPLMSGLLLLVHGRELKAKTKAENTAMPGETA